MKLIFQTLILLFICSCSKPEKEFERENLVIGEQKFEILTANRIFENYILAGNNYTSLVFNPIKNEFETGAEYPLIFRSIENEIIPDERLKEYIRLFQEINLREIVESTFQKGTKELPGPETKILFIPANPGNAAFFEQYKISVTAITVGSGKIIVSINPTAENWKEMLPYVLAHEYHHSVWTARNFKTKDFTPLEYLIFEGRADSFAKNLFPEVNSTWTNMIDKNQEKQVWAIIKTELFKRETDMNDLMMIGNEDIPYGSGYTIGFNIVEEFKKNNREITDNILMDLAPEKVLQLSLYDKQ